MGFFKKLKDSYKQQRSEALAAEFRATKARIQENQEFEKEIRLFEEQQKDKSFLKEHEKYLKVSVEIDEKYSILTSMGDFNTPAADKLLQVCFEQIERAKKLAPKWKKYDRGVGRINAYQRIAMIYEKQGEYMKSAETCLQAVKDGQKEDGTKGGMLGRMTRMLKKGNLEPTEDMKTVLMDAFKE